MSSEIMKAIKALCEEKNLPYEAVLATIEAALAAAYRKDFGNKLQNIKVKFDPETGAIQAWDVKTVVEDIEEEALEKAQEELSLRREKAFAENRELTDEETADLPRFNPKMEIMLKDAKAVSKKNKVGDVLETKLEIPGEFGRMAAQTAKQVIIQKIREAERGMVFDDFKRQEGQLIIGVIQRVEGRKVLIDLGKVTGILPVEQQIQNEFYRPGSKMKFLLQSVEMSSRGPEIVLSRTDKNIIKEIFKQEIPEVGEGQVKVKEVARDAGFRSKVAVSAEDESIDPIGSCIGQRGSRIKTIIEELGGEKMDIILYSEEPKEYIANALSPAKVKNVELKEEEKTADVLVASDQFSLAIGRSGQNVRLASEMSGWKINVIDEGGSEKAAATDEAPTEEEAKEEESVPTDAESPKAEENKKEEEETV